MTANDINHVSKLISFNNIILQLAGHTIEYRYTQNRTNTNLSVYVSYVKFMQRRILPC